MWWWPSKTWILPATRTTGSFLEPFMLPVPYLCLISATEADLKWLLKLLQALSKHRATTSKSSGRVSGLQSASWSNRRARLLWSSAHLRCLLLHLDLSVVTIPSLSTKPATTARSQSPVQIRTLSVASALPTRSTKHRILYLEYHFLPAPHHLPISQQWCVVAWNIQLK